MTTVITYLDSRRVQVASHTLIGGAVNFVADIQDFNRHHSGRWNSGVLSFVPDPTCFSDGTPVSHYTEDFDDLCGIYTDYCLVCGVATNGNRYCGTSCAEKDQEEQ